MNSRYWAGQYASGMKCDRSVPDGSDMEFWVVDKTGRLNEAYDKITGGIKNGKPAHATLKVEYNGKWDDGFAAEYSGVYFVREVIAIQAE